MLFPVLWQSHRLRVCLRLLWERNINGVIREASSTSVPWRSTRQEEQKNIKGEQTSLSSLWWVCYMLSVFICNTHITKSNHCFAMPCCETCPQASDSLEDDVKASVYQWLYCSTVSFWAFCASGSKTRHHFLAKSVLIKCIHTAKNWQIIPVLRWIMDTLLLQIFSSLPCKYLWFSLQAKRPSYSLFKSMGDWLIMLKCTSCLNQQTRVDLLLLEGGVTYVYCLAIVTVD